MTGTGTRDRSSVASGETRGLEIIRRAVQTIRRHMAGAAAFSALIALLYLAPSIYMMQIYDRVLTTGGLMTLVFMSLLLLVALATHSFLEGARQRLLTRAAVQIDQELSPTLLRTGFRNAGSPDPKRNQIMREFDLVRQAMQGPGATGLLDLPFVPVFIIVSFLLHPSIGLVVLLGAGVLVMIAVAGERATKKAQSEAASRTPSIYAALEMSQAQGGTIRALGMQSALSERLIDERYALNDITTRNAFVAGRYSGLTRLLRMILQSGVLGLGAYLAIIQEISPGALIAGSILAGRALAPIEQVVGSWRQLSQGRTAFEAVRSFLNAAPSDMKPMPLPAPIGRIDAEHVSLRAGGSDRWAIYNVSFQVLPGESLGILGSSGAGKSTLARGLVGAQPFDGGTVRIDGGSLTDWDTEALGRYIGYLPQDLGLLPGTVGENISRFSRDGNAPELTVKAAREAGVHDLIQKLPHSYDTRIGFNGAGLSAGQAQRIALARSLYNEPSVLVLDEPNSHLDSDGDVVLAAAVRNAKARGAAVIVITHRSGIIAEVDKLLILKDGRVDQLGLRDEVLARLRNAAVQARRIRAVSGSTPP
ncbi:MAG: type I secretion system permease/ATPase [Alphaproteobacteria bacterium]|nr:type I secretion system permease/ATPase [Alphaproteobacteria bacterium]